MTDNDDIHVLHWQAEDLLGRTSVRNLLFSNDPRLVGLKGILFALIMLALGGVMAMTFRGELAAPGIQFLGAKAYINTVTIHGMIMVFAFAIPITVSILYYMLPVSLGLDRLHAAWAAHLSFWTIVAAGTLLAVARPDFTWAFYAPLSLRVAGDLLWMGHVAIILVGVSEFFAGVALLATVLAWKRASGGSWLTMPLIGWGALAEAGILVLSAPMLSVVGSFLLLDGLGVTALYDPSRGGSALTFLWMSWFYGHPAVYLPLVPIIGVLYAMLPRLLGRPLWSHVSGVIAFSLLFLVGFAVWHHHFQTEATIHGPVQKFFELTTLLIIVPSSLHVFNWIATLWQGPIPPETRRSVPFKFIVGAIFMIIVGGVNGFLNGQITIDTDFIHNTYWLPGHFHALFLGFIAQMSMAGIYFLFPYFTGRMFSQRLADLHFWLWQLGIFAQVMLMFALGLSYFPRWVVDYLPLPEWVTGQLWLTVAGGVVGLGFVVFIVNVLVSVRRGERVAGDPWPVSAVSAQAAVVAAE